jgi:4-alpha-glucanotransferase
LINQTPTVDEHIYKQKEEDMKLFRASGILLHPTSLPGNYGIGDFGNEARRFIDFLAETKQKLWQMLPLGTTGYGNSPYQSFSSSAGNYLLISPEILVEEKLLEPSELKKAHGFSTSKADYIKAEEFKFGLLKKSFENFKKVKENPQVKAFNEFCKEKQSWLDDFSLFMALKEHHNNKPWYEWGNDIVKRKPEAIEHWKKKLADQIKFHKYLQFQFFKQWKSLKAYANDRGIKTIGDIPVYAAHNSVDVWVNPQYFKVDNSGKLIALSGVPPDYYCSTGQLWGNPTYRWDVLKETGYRWWVERLRSTLDMVDMVRLDHFRGFESFWEVPAGETTAINGKWIKCPGEDLLSKFKEIFGDIPIIAENLGVITPEVEGLRNKFELPGMIVLQFAFESDYAQFSFEELNPDNFPKRSAIYTGTHDNNTTVGWYNEKPGEDTTLSPEDVKQKKERLLGYFKTDGSQIHWDMIGEILRSASHFAVIPLQDVLGLGKEARMNTPGTATGNWEWRFSWNMLTEDIKKKLKELTAKHNRG